MLSRYFCLTISNDICDTSDTYDTCFQKNSLTRAGRKNFSEKLPARLRERVFLKTNVISVIRHS